MPLTQKGEEIKKNLEKEYGPKKAEQVLYAGKNAGTFTGIDAQRRANIDRIMDARHERLKDKV